MARHSNHRYFHAVSLTRGIDTHKAAGLYLDTGVIGMKWIFEKIWQVFLGVLILFWGWSMLIALFRSPIFWWICIGYAAIMGIGTVFFLFKRLFTGHY